MWNYRILSYPGKDKSEAYYGLVEAIYNESGGLCAHDEEPILTGESPNDILESLNLMINDVKLHCQDSSIVLDVDAIVYESFFEDDEDMESLAEFKFDHDE
jgi:hypothetical protein